MLVEICANSLQSAWNAEKGGADRIELCSELAVGGITPSYGVLKSVKAHISIPIHVLIRPRSGDFTYSDLEFEIMKKDIALCKDLGFEGIVAGVLHEDLTLDVERTRSLIEASKGLHFTFHRAFDWVGNPLSTLEKLDTIGADTILTSGQQRSAIEGMDLLKQLQERETSTIIMPGGGITPSNVHTFKDNGFKVVHLSGSTSVKTLPTSPHIPMSAASNLSDDTQTITDLETVRQVVERLK